MRVASDATGRPMSRAALLFVGAAVAAGCGGRSQASATSDGGSDGASSESGGGGDDWDGRTAASAPVQDGGASEASSDASTDAPSDATESEDADPLGGGPLFPPSMFGPPGPAPGESTAAYGPATVDPAAAAMYGPAVVSHYGPAPTETPSAFSNYGPAVIAEPAPNDTDWPTQWPPKEQ